ncbi:hypothetical protein BDR26DRAFT_865275 [Obelidium mucronatum]|nr:hypothetical protein BDR26DRAFT_865275 [Obelidium mucronatum]
MKTPPASVKRNAKKSRRDRLEEGGSSSSRRMDQDAASDSDTSDQGEQVFIVEEIINHRYNKRRLRMEYHVKWSGYPSSDNSWEPSESFMATGILEAYQDEHFDSFPRSVQRQLGSSLNRSRGQQKPPSKKRRRSSSEESARFQKDSDTSSEIDDRPPLDSTEEDHADTTTTTTAYTEEVIEEGSCHHFGPGIEVEKGVFLPAVPENRIEELEDEAMPESTIRDETRNERLSSKVATSSTAVPDNVNDSNAFIGFISFY